MTLWAAQWHSFNQLDGNRKHIITGDDCLPKLFRTRQECREYIKEKFGYIPERPDLRAEPHGWRTPTAIKVIILHLIEIESERQLAALWDDYHNKGGRWDYSDGQPTYGTDGKSKDTFRNRITYLKNIF